MDKIITSLLEEFVRENDVNETEEALRFELFSAYATLSGLVPDPIDPYQVWLEDDKSPGIDSVAIFVNGKLCDSEEEAADLINMNGFLEVKFAFIQSKTSQKFEMSQINQFGITVGDFFEERPQFKRGRRLEEKAKLAEFLYKNSGKMTRGRPVCLLFYVTTGIWADDANLRGSFENSKRTLEQKNLFSEVLVTPIDADRLRQNYMNTRMSLSVDVILENKTTLPEALGIPEAYLGYLPFSEFLKVISDENENLRESIFYDNVRGFQGENEVNKHIATTINEGRSPEFIYLNNGVTIVAKSLSTTGKRATLRDYQIVNGCQTSHVLFKCRKQQNIERLSVPIKLVVTQDENLVAKIIRATNHQTEVKAEDIASLSDFQKKLETFYEANKTDKLQLCYERRSGQFASKSVQRTKIVTIPAQIKAFASMFLNEPHRVSGYYGTIVKKLEKKIFSPSHSLMPYFCSGLAAFRLDYLFRQKSIDSKYKRARYHLLMLFRLIATQTEMPSFESKDIERYCAPLKEALLSNDESGRVFNKAVEIVERNVPHFGSGDDFKSQKLTQALEASWKKMIIENTFL